MQHLSSEHFANIWIVSHKFRKHKKVLATLPRNTVGSEMRSAARLWTSTTLTGVFAILLMCKQHITLYHIVKKIKQIPYILIRIFYK